MTTPLRSAASWARPWPKGNRAVKAGGNGCLLLFCLYLNVGCNRRMLKEYLIHQKSDSICWNDYISGVETCRFALQPEGSDALTPIPVCGEPLHFEALFCLKGRLVIQPFRHVPCALEAPGIFLLSDSSKLHSCQCSKDLGGIFVTVDAAASKESLQTICSALGMNLNTKNVRDRMTAENGYIALAGTSWVQAFFEIMKRLPDNAQERYCVFKSVELLYLLCSEMPASDESKSESAGISYRMLKIREYMQEHLSEKITIQLLCREFLVSPTFLKENFRRAYGIPVHTWLIRQRIRRARELIFTTQLPIQKIAQIVGYESISRFNAAFKEYYGITPGQCRKMSETASFRPF